MLCRTAINTSNTIRTQTVAGRTPLQRSGSNSCPCYYIATRKRRVLKVTARWQQRRGRSLRSTIVWLSSHRDEYDRYELRVGRRVTDDELVVNISVMNRGEDAHEATVTMTLPPQLAFRRSDQRVYSATTMIYYAQARPYRGILK